MPILLLLSVMAVSAAFFVMSSRLSPVSGRQTGMGLKALIAAAVFLAPFSVAQAAPGLTLAPAAGALPDATLGVFYSQTFTATGGDGEEYAFALIGMPPLGMTFNGSTLSGTPTIPGHFNFTISVTDGWGSVGSASYILAVSVPPTTTSITPSSGLTSGGNVVTITGTNFSGATNVSFGGVSGTGITVINPTVIIATAPAHSSGSVDVTVTTPVGTGTLINGYTYLGASLETTTSVSATPNPSSVGDIVVITAKVSAPIYGRAAFAPTGTVTFTGPGGIALVGTLNDEGYASVSTSELQSGTVTAHYDGDSNFAASTGSVIVEVNPAEKTPTTTTVSATPNHSVEGQTVQLTATVSASYLARAIAAPTGTITFTGPGGLNQKVALDVSGVAILSTTALATGTVTALYNGDSDFAGSTGTVEVEVDRPTSFTFSPAGGALKEAMAGEDYKQSISATGGTGSLTYSVVSGTLPNGMVLNVTTGELTGPTSADSEGDYAFTIEARDGGGKTGTATYTLKVQPREVTVTDKVVNVPAGGTPANVYLNREATGGPFTSADLTFVEPSNAGTATIIQGELAASGPIVAPTGWYLQFTPNPAFSGQARVGFRLISALGISNAGTVTYNLNYDPGQVAEDIDALVHGFVRTRQNLIANTIKVPGLMERRQMASSTEAVTTKVSPSLEGMTLGFSTSLSQLEGARDTADGITDAAPSLFNVWIDGTFMAHNRDENGSKWGSFAAISLGADYLLTEKALVGLSFHYDHMTDPTDEDAELTGNGWLAGPYASFEIGRGVFWDTSILYGGSSNDIDTQFWDGSFDTTRWLFDTSIKGQWQLDDVTVVTPKLRAVYFSEEVDDYAVRNEPGDILELDGFKEEQFRVSLGAEIAKRFTLENDNIVTPKLGATVGYSGLDGDGAFGSVSAGVNLQTPEGWELEAGLLFNIEGDGQTAAGGKIGVSRRF